MLESFDPGETRMSLRCPELLVTLVPADRERSTELLKGYRTVSLPTTLMKAVVLNTIIIVSLLVF